MKVILLMLICVLNSGAYQLPLKTDQFTADRDSQSNNAPSQKVPTTFIGTVKSIEPLGKRELQVIPIDLDSSFAITIHIESVTPKEAPLEDGTDQVFAVHSPARLFSAVEEEIIGRKYHFKVTWNGDRHRFSNLTAGPSSSSASAKNKPLHHYVFFGMDREKLKDAKSFLETPAFDGAQVAYSWRQLEQGKDNYEFSMIREDLAFLEAHGKKLWLQIQDVMFSPRWKPVPDYILKDPQYHGGVDRQFQYKSGDEARGRGRRWSGPALGPGGARTISKVAPRIGQRV